MYAAPVRSEDSTAIIASQESRYALNRIREKMAAGQLGEAFHGIDSDDPFVTMTLDEMGKQKIFTIDSDDPFEIPKFLRREPGSDAKTREWNAAHPLPKTVTSFSSLTAAHEPTEFEKQLLADEEAEKAALTSGKRLAKKEEKEARSSRGRGRRAKATEPMPLESATTGGQYWDAAANCFRPIGYMSPARYAHLLSEMPDERYRAAFIKMFGHTQPEDKRSPSAASLKKLVRATQEATRGPAAVRRADKAKAAKPAKKAAAAPTKARQLNPEHDAKVSAMLSRPEGATLTEIGATMGWQEHSASAFLSGIRKTRTIVKTVDDRGNVYRLETAS